MQRGFVVVTPTPKGKVDPRHGNQIAVPRAEKSIQDAEPSKHGFEHHPQATENPDSIALDSPVPRNGIDSRGFEDPPSLSDRFPLVVKAQGKYRELRCHICGVNAYDNGKYFESFAKLIPHVVSHRDAVHTDLERHEKLEKYCTERMFDDVDVQMMLEGKEPASGPIGITRPKDIHAAKAILSKTQPLHKEPANPKARGTAAKVAGRFNTRSTAATHVHETLSTANTSPRNIDKKTPRGGFHPTESTSRLPKPSPRVASPPSSSADELRGHADGSPTLRGPEPREHERIDAAGVEGSQRMATRQTTRQPSSLAVERGEGLFSGDFKVDNNAPRRALHRKASGLPKKERH